MKTLKRGRSAPPRGLRAGITAAVLTVVACFGAAIALAHVPSGPKVAAGENGAP